MSASRAAQRSEHATPIRRARVPAWWHAAQARDRRRAWRRVVLAVTVADRRCWPRSAIVLVTGGSPFFAPRARRAERPPLQDVQAAHDGRTARTACTRRACISTRSTARFSRFATIRGCIRWAASCAARASTNCRIFINVLRGEMSLVGPRPPLPCEVEHYDALRARRLRCKPGITCLWQINGPQRRLVRAVDGAR